MYIKGVPTIVVVDDFLPNGTRKGTEIDFDKIAADGSLWGPMIEKIWAKVNGNYENINEGSVTEGYDFMLGAPSIEY